MLSTFEDWYKKLTEDEIWFEPVKMHHKPETLESIGRRVYMHGIADKERFSITPMSEFRRHFYNIVCKTPGDKPKNKDWHIKALEKENVVKQEQWKPASPEHVDKCVAEFDEMMKNSTMINSMPRVGYKQSIEEGGWLPKKPAPYPTTSKEEAYVRQRHLEYVKNNYEPRTGQPLPDWIPEHEFNLLYDNEML